MNDMKPICRVILKNVVELNALPIHGDALLV
jgi:hypothetical protein